MVSLDFWMLKKPGKIRRQRIWMKPCKVGGHGFGWIHFNYLQMQCIHLKSVNSNFTLAVHSPKLNNAKTHFLSHHNVSIINRFAKFQTSDLWLAQSTSDLLIVGSNLGLAIFFLFFSDKKWVLAWLSFGECTDRVKLELSNFSWTWFLQLDFSKI